VGGLANLLANHLDIENADHRTAVQNFWQSPTISTHAGLKAVDLFQACAAGKIKALWIMSTNPAVSLPDADNVAKAIANVPFVAVSDIMARTDTGDLADVLLPATGWGEKDGTVTNSERRISRQRAFMPAPGEARPDWKAICDVARRMGWSDAFDYTSPADIFAEYVGLSVATTDFGRDLDLSVFADADYANLIPTQWPQNDKRFFADGKFFHADAKACMLPVCAPKSVVREGLILNTGRNRDQWHTMTRSGKSPRLGAHLAEPYAEIHPDDAGDVGVTSGDLLKLETAYGHGILRALVTKRTAQGSIFAPIHWTRQQSNAGWVNALVSPIVDPVSAQPAFKNSAVTARKFEVEWYGYAVSLHPMLPSADYAAVARSLTGWQGEYAGIKAPSNWEALARKLMDIEADNASVMHDPYSGQTRIAFHDGDQLTGLFFAGKDPVSLSRTHAVSLIGTSTPPLLALAGRSGADQPDAGTTICACMNVGINTLRDAITAGADNVEALGIATCAGTNCGSCKPELAELIAQIRLPMAAE
jgi:assimilatory nitrate reductase catalytic subunit